MSQQDARHAVVILAAGAAERMGTPKQLLDIGGQPMVRHAALIAIDSGANPVIVVVGAQADDVQIAVQDLPVVVTVNHRWQDGIGTSIQAGLWLAEFYGVSSVTMMPADQPLLSAATLRAFAARREVSRAPVVAAKCAGTAGMPAVFGRAVFADLHALEATDDCTSIIRAYRAHAVLMSCPEAAIDIDTPADYARIARLQGSCMIRGQ